jgi:hypothetical protein
MLELHPYDSANALAAEVKAEPAVHVVARSVGRRLGGAVSQRGEADEPASRDAMADLGSVLDQVDRADVVIFDGRSEQGFMAGAELMFARTKGTPVVVVCPDDSPYRQNGHDETPYPMLLGMCDHVARSMAEALEWARAIYRSPRYWSGQRPDAAVTYFRSTASDRSRSHASLKRD